MSRPPHARERVLDALETLLIDEGGRAATIEATARAAGVSKGGLLYHFGSREALEAGLIERLATLVDADIEEMSTAPEGPVAYFVRTSAMSTHPLDRTMVALARLAQGGSAPAAASLRATRERWMQALRPHTADQTGLDLVMLVSDGLYYDSALVETGADGSVPTGGAMDALVALVVRATKP